MVLISFAADSQDLSIAFGFNKPSIINVRVVSLSDGNNHELRELDCICENTSKIYRVKLEGIWSSTPVKIGSSLRVIGAKMKGEEVISHYSGYTFFNQELKVSLTINISKNHI